MAIVSVSVVPLGTGSPSVSDYVARALKVAEKQKGVKVELTPMGTVLEGDLDQVLTLIRQMHESVFDEDVKRVLTSIRIDDRRDKLAMMEEKVRSVQQKLHQA
ncbi:MAG: MTH1187 family thiamine-binding protein [Dehalococcoidia bacterium]|nr:MTH1187 family thiamine-binding protein [Dehalococcoidia bacterium]